MKVLILSAVAFLGLYAYGLVKAVKGPEVRIECIDGMVHRSINVKGTDIWKVRPVTEKCFVASEERGDE